jgi:YVTN family beta-propeller protein
MENTDMNISSKIQTVISIGLATILLGAFAAKAEPIVYVPLGSDDKIVVINAADDTITAKISGLTSVHGLAATPDGRFLIAGSYTERSLYGVPEKPNEISEDDHAAHHKVQDKKELSDSDASVSTVSVIRTSDQTVVRAIDVPGAVHHVAVSPDGRYAALTLPAEDKISVINLENYKVVANPEHGSLPNYSTFSPDGTKLYVSMAGDDAVVVFTVGTWTKETVISVGSSPEHVALSKNGETLYVNNVDEGTVSVVNTKSGIVNNTIPIGSTVHGIDLSDDEAKLFVAALGDDKLFQIDLVSGSSRAVTIKPEPYHLTVIPGTGKLYISSAEEPKIWVVDENDLKILGQITIGGKGHQMVPISGS